MWNGLVELKEYPRIDVTVDVVLIGRKAGVPHILLIKRANQPYQGHYALPGGFVDTTDLSIPEAASRELLEETGVQILPKELALVDVLGSPTRDPRGYFTTVAYRAEVPELLETTAGDDAKVAEWIPWSQINAGQVPLAFDHSVIVERAMRD